LNSAEGATYPETLRQKDRINKLWKMSKSSTEGAIKKKLSGKMTDG
tara:strand:+ start:97 stop:234 length:138 start_codon:yes stop_codon:yes gene_type:complete